MSGIRTFFIPVIVGTGSLFLLEDAKEFKILILFSAAYAANGTKVLPAIISLYIYHLITESFVEQNESENDENVSKKKPE
jgi:hypothetical protein